MARWSTWICISIEPLDAGFTVGLAGAGAGAALQDMRQFGRCPCAPITCPCCMCAYHMPLFDLIASVMLPPSTVRLLVLATEGSDTAPIQLQTGSIVPARCKHCGPPIKHRLSTTPLKHAC